MMIFLYCAGRTEYDLYMIVVINCN